MLDLLYGGWVLALSSSPWNSHAAAASHEMGRIGALAILGVIAMAAYRRLTARVEERLSSDGDAETAAGDNQTASDSRFPGLEPYVPVYLDEPTPALSAATADTDSPKETPDAHSL